MEGEQGKMYAIATLIAVVITVNTLGWGAAWGVFGIALLIKILFD